MKPALVSVALCLCGLSASAQAPGDIQKRLAGNWRLVAFQNFDEKGVARAGAYDEGRIMYDAHGNMAAQLSRNGRKPLSAPSTEAERAAAYASYLAYYGRFVVDPVKGLVQHHVEGSTNPNWVKTTLVRYYEFRDNDTRLLLSLKDASGRVTGTLTWERMR